MLIRRLITSTLLILIIIGVITIDWLCGLTVALFIAVGLYEFFRMLEAKGTLTYKYFGIGIGVLIPLSIMLRRSNSTRVADGVLSSSMSLAVTV